MLLVYISILDRNLSKLTPLVSDTGCSGLGFFEKVARFLVFKRSCQKPKKLLKVVEVVKICGAIVAHPWRGRGGPVGRVTTSRIRASVYSMPALNQKVIRKPEPLPRPH